MNVNLELHENLKARLRILGSGISALAREIGVSPSSVTTVSQGYRTSHRIQEAIARKLGTEPELLFPERYTQKNQNNRKEETTQAGS
ncbi:MAG: helix-turn-helix domain-containing protein [Hyphomicrobiales bacterium]